MKSFKYVNEKRLSTGIVALKEYISENQTLTVKWINSKKQLANVLTKQGANSYMFLKLLNNGCL